MYRGPAPQGLQDSAQGFNPGKPHNKRFALKLKGREMRVPVEPAPIAAQDQSAQLGRAVIGPSDPASALLGRSIWRPLRGASLLVG
jgi:hypothetical protein